MCSRYYVDPDMMEEIIKVVQKIDHGRNNQSDTKNRSENPSNAKRYPSDRCGTSHWTDGI